MDQCERLRINREVAVAAGRCGWCRKPRQQLAFMCDACAAKHRERQKKKVLKARARGKPCNRCRRSTDVCVPNRPGRLCWKCYDEVRPGAVKPVVEEVVEPIAPPVVKAERKRPTEKLHFIVGTRPDGDRLVIDEAMGLEPAVRLAAQYRENLEGYVTILPVAEERFVGSEV